MPAFVRFLSRSEHTPGDPQYEAGRIRDYFGHRGRSSWWDRGREYLVRERQQQLGRARAFVRETAETLRILDVGCGSGDDLLHWRSVGVPESNLAGTELIHERAEMARALLPKADVIAVDGFELPFESGAFHVVSASLVLSTIGDPELRRQLFSEMVRVTAPGGVVVVHEFRIRKPTNRQVTAISQKRARALGLAPDETWTAGPLLPVLSLVLRLPAGLRRLALAALPRTHATYVWRPNKLRGPNPRHSSGTRSVS